ncbi:hypothetical protein AWB70_03082 [Caballeronia cordobensis]|uniref:Zinc-ribbon domain-containing protein n=1 Tax=Caballeronia cordobensis TaxID=1353886 RepID=A0A158HAD5_CABCO|nr:zinc ribbon domain-containing protein [Caballeronia cordobensis]SAL40949.1 hypothetical protein AWB70_03082 [Caballeronia cordobensis]
MTTRLTFPASMFSVVCQRCGSTVRKNADSCPNCGADRSAAFGQKREARAEKPRAPIFDEAAAPLASASASASVSASHASGSIGGRGEASERVEPGLRSRWTERASERIAQKAAEYRTRRAEESARNAYAESSNDPDALPGSDRWSQKKTIIAGACGLVLVLGAMFYYQLGDSDHVGTPSAEHSVSGAIDSKVGALVRGATDTSSTSVMPTAPVTAERHAPADTRTARASSGDALQDVRFALDQHDLASARALLKVLPAQQQARAEYETLKDELVKREAQRDAALQLARACERTSAWACVQQNAGEALALDGSNIESQAMLERVISHAGWLAPTAAAALAKKMPGAGPAAGDTANTAAAAAPRAGAAAPAPVPAQANVAAAAPSAKPNAFAQKPAAERRPGQRSAAAARQAEEDARADKIARGQAATDALTATIMPPPTVATTMTPPPAPAAQAPRPATPSAQAAAPSSPQPAAKSNTARAPYYLGDEEAQPSASANARSANPRAPYYLGDEAAQPARPANSRGAYYLGEDPPQPSAPAPRASAPRAAQPANQSSALPPSTSTMQAAVPRTPAASAQPAAQTATAQPQRVPVVSQPGTPAAAAPRATQPAAAAATSPQFAAMPAGSHIDSDKTEELERAIKQYGWSGGESTPKPSR